MDMTWVLGLVLGILPLLIWVLRSFNEWRYCCPQKGGKLPPGHMGWPIFGELFDFLWHFKFTGTPDDFILKRKAKYGDCGIYRTHLFGSPSIITCTPEVNRYIMGNGTEDGSFTSGWPSPELIGENSINIVEGDHHKRLRRHLLEAINRPASLQNIFVRLQPVFKETFKNWSAKGKIHSADETRTMAFKNICSLLFSFQGGPILVTMEMMYRGLLDGLRAHPINVRGTAYYHAVQCRQRLSAIMLSEMRDRKANKGNKKIDYLQALMDSVNQDSEALTEEEILDTVTSVILAGYESTASSMTWALYYLSKYPKVLHKLQEEIISIRKEKGEDKFLKYNDVQKMPYTLQVVDEVIRLANVANFMFRTVEKDTQFNGYKFPKGWKVIIWIRSLHVDPQYFKDPLEFNPDRWEGFKPRPGIHSVFGGGPRLCPGNNLARVQILMFLHYLCLDYKWTLLNPNEVIKFLPNPRLADGAKLNFSRI